ncbi:MAG: hypothetical protein EBZ48_05625 [Proteobacteria bacterium]|nr:hypothetical protein [Pseudomonadota bacterium]
MKLPPGTACSRLRLPRWKGHWCSIALLSGAICIGGCALFDTSEPSRYSGLADSGDGSAQVGSPVRLESATLAAAGETNGSAQLTSGFIEVLWEIPSQPVLGYTIRYGTDPLVLSWI